MTVPVIDNPILNSRFAEPTRHWVLDGNGVPTGMHQHLAADRPMLQACDAKLQGRTAKLTNPHAPDTLAWFAWIVARLGGWSGYTSTGYKPPGPKTVARGLHKLDAMTAGWKLARVADVRLP